MNIILLKISDSSINAPPSFRPAKKYSDISGLPVSDFLHLYDWLWD